MQGLNRHAELFGLPRQSYQDYVRNTFLDFPEERTLGEDDEEDPWIIEADPHRLYTDSVMHDRNLRLQLESSVLQALQTVERSLSSASSNDQAGVDDIITGAGPLNPLLASPDWWPSKAAPAFPGYSLDASQAYLRNSIDSYQQADDIEDAEAEAYEAGAMEHAEAEGDDSKQIATKQVDPEVLAAREVAVMGGGLSGFTTVMVRNVPSRYTQQKLMREINSMGFLGKYDFFYLPVQPHGRGNRGFAFANFSSSEAAEQFYGCLNGKPLRHFAQDMPVAVLPADMQGFEKNAEHYATMCSSRSQRRPLQSGRALFFKPLPPHLSAQMASGFIEVVGDHPELGQQLAQPALRGSSAGYSNGQTTFPKVPGRLSDSAFKQRGMQENRQLAAQQQSASESTPTQKFCAFCGKAKPPDHMFCTFCGQKARS